MDDQKMAGIEESNSEVSVRFVTKQDSLVVPDDTIAVPTKIKPQDLNNLIIALLKQSSDVETSIEFDFLVSGQFLRLPLIEHCQTLNVSTEDIVEIEYLVRTPAPEPQDSLLHDDWVGAIHVADKWILTGCYDNAINVWSIRGKHILNACKHTDEVRAVSWLKQGDPTGGFVSASQDLTAVLWEWLPKEDSKQIDCKPVVVLKGHESGINAIAVSPDSQNVATGGWDEFVKVWSASLNAEEEEPVKKKGRLVTTTSSSDVKTRSPLYSLKGHKENVVGIQWVVPDTLCTVSMDHKMIFWDTELQGIKDEIIAEKAFTGVSWSRLNGQILGCFADRHIRLYDPRAKEGSVCKLKFTSHSLWVSSVAWSQTNENLFMSGSYDKVVKLWDTRSPKAPLYDMSGHQDKILCVDWSNSKYLVSGGADKNVHIFKNKISN